MQIRFGVDNINIQEAIDTSTQISMILLYLCGTSSIPIKPANQEVFQADAIMQLSVDSEIDTKTSSQNTTA